MTQPHLQQPSPLLLPVLPCRIFYSTQSGRAKACARRSARIINDCTNHDTSMKHEPPQGHPMAVQLQNGHGMTFDDALYDFMKYNTSVSVEEPKSTIEQFVHELKKSGTKVLLCFISTTGDGEHTVRRTAIFADNIIFARMLTALLCLCLSILFRTQFKSFGSNCRFFFVSCS